MKVKFSLCLVLVLLLTSMSGAAFAAGNHGNIHDEDSLGELHSLFSNDHSVTTSVYGNQLLQQLLNNLNLITVFNVKNSVYGAAGDGVRDDTNSLQEALDAARASGGGIVYFPPGTYITTKELNVYSNTKIVGANAKISKTPEGAGDSVINVATDQSLVTIEGMWIENNKTKGNIGINMKTGSSLVMIKENKFTGQKTQAVNINASGVKHIQIHNNVFQEVAFGVLTNAHAKDLEDVRILNNQFLNIYGDAIELNHPGTAYVAGANFIIANNYMLVPTGFGSGAKSGFGIGIAGATNISITGNVIHNARYEAIHIEDEAKHISIVGNVINGVANDPDNGLNSGVYVIDSDYITITGNTVRNAKDYGIHLEINASAQSPTNTIISANTVTASGSGGIKVNVEGPANTIVSDNLVTDNSGNGILIGGNGQNVQVTNNISRNNSGYGLYFGTSAVGRYVAANSLYGNTLGDIGYHANYRYPTAVRNKNTVVTGKVMSNAINQLNTFSLGKAAEGVLYVTVAKSPRWSTMMYKLSWDGTTLTTTPINGDQSGNMELQQPSMDGDVLQMNAIVPSTPNDTEIIFDVQFDGMIMSK